MGDFSMKDSATGRRSTTCKPCHRKYLQGYYVENKGKYVEKAMEWNRAQRRVLTDLVVKVKDRPCMDCGNSYHPCVMDFDHRVPQEKVANISRLVALPSSVEKLQREMSKCDVVCANCHRMREWERTHRLTGKAAGS